MHPNYEISAKRREAEEFQEYHYGQGSDERKLDAANDSKLDEQLEEELRREEEAQAEAFWMRMYEKGEITWNPAEL